LQPLTGFCSCGGHRCVILSVLCVCQALSLANRRELLEKLNMPPGCSGQALMHTWKTYLQALFPGTIPKSSNGRGWWTKEGRAVFFGFG
jgi:hypothetical protein